MSPNRFKAQRMLELSAIFARQRQQFRLINSAKRVARHSSVVTFFTGNVVPTDFWIPIKSLAWSSRRRTANRDSSISQPSRRGLFPTISGSPRFAGAQLASRRNPGLHFSLWKAACSLSVDIFSNVF